MLLINLQSQEEYQKQRSTIFPSRSSLDWFIRVNREELMELNALSWPTRRLMIRADAFDEAVLAIGKKALQSSKQNEQA